MENEIIKPDVCVSENGFLYTGQAARAIQKCWDAIDFSERIKDAGESYITFESKRN